MPLPYSEYLLYRGSKKKNADLKFKSIQIFKFELVARRVFDTYQKKSVPIGWLCIQKRFEIYIAGLWLEEFQVVEYAKWIQIFESSILIRCWREGELIMEGIAYAWKGFRWFYWFEMNFKSACKDYEKSNLTT